MSSTPGADIGLIGLAVMGENLVLNMESRGFTVAVYNRTTSKVDDFVNGRGKGKKIVGCRSVKELVAALKRPRKVMIMVKAGPAVDAMINEVEPLLEPLELMDEDLEEAAAPPIPPPSAEAQALMAAPEEALDAELLAIFMEEAHDVLATIATSVTAAVAHDAGATALVHRPRRDGGRPRRDGRGRCHGDDCRCYECGESGAPTRHDVPPIAPKNGPTLQSRQAIHRTNRASSLA